MPVGPLLERIVDGDTLWARHRTTWVDANGATHLAMFQQPEMTFFEDEGFAHMLVDEAAILRHLDHPNVTRLFETGTRDGAPYLVVEWIEGRTLEEATRAAGAADVEFPLGLACWILASVARGLDHAQNVRVDGGAPLGVIHRDITPANIRLGWDGSVRLGGFGMARADLLTRTVTVPGLLKGRFVRMSPEQVMGRRLTGKTDVFGCGILLYELATGVLPFTGESDFETLERVREATPRPPQELRPSLATAVVHVIEQALAKEPERRPTAAAFAEMLDALAGTAVEPSGPRVLTAFLRRLFEPESLDR